MRKPLFGLLIVLAVFIFGWSNTAEASSDHYVSTTGVNNSICSQTNPCRTIEHTIDVAHDGDTIHVGGGNYYESVTIKKSLTILGNPTCTPCTIWYSGGNIQVMVINNSATVTIQDFNIRDGSGVNGGAIIAGSGTTVTLTDLYIYNSDAYRGGAIYNRGNMTLDDVLVKDNKSETIGGAIYNEGSLAIRNSRIFDNYAGSTGGALYNLGTVDAEESDLFSNAAYRSGGAIYNEGTIQFESGEIYSNEAEHGSGGGVYNNNGGHFVAVNAEISKNEADSPCHYFAGERTCIGSTPHGGGVYSDEESFLILSFVEMYSNRVDAADEWDGKGGAVASWGESIIAFSTLEANLVDTEDYNAPYGDGSAFGGGFYNAGQSRVYNSTFNDNLVDGNGSPVKGGGIYNDEEGEMNIENSTITNNIADGLSEGVGGGIYNKGQLNAIHITVSHNLAGDIENPEDRNGSGIYNVERLDITNSIVAMNYGVDCANINALNALGENLDSDGTCPDFSQQGKDPLLGSLKNNGGPTYTRLISWSSPALDSADSELCHSNDQRNYSRPYGDGCDLGAVELSSVDD